MFALPVSVLMTAFIWMFLFFRFRPSKTEWTEIDKYTFASQRNAPGRSSREERIIFVVFVVLAFLWIFRTDLDLAKFSIPGWAGLFPESKFINDGSIAIFMAVILFYDSTEKRRNSA